MLRDAIARWRVRNGPAGREITGLFDDLEGQILLEEARFLYHAPAMVRGPLRTIVEIGSFRGKSCVMLARGALAARPDDPPALFAIDPRLNQAGLSKAMYSDADHDAFLAALGRHGVSGHVTPIRQTSRDAYAGWDGREIDLLWVDGDHNYEPARFDMENWGRHVRVGGLIAAHDCRKGSDVARAWADAIAPDPRWGSTGRARSIRWAIRDR